MLHHIANILSAAELGECRKLLDAAEWVDGRITAGYQAARVKHNRQIAEEHPNARKAANMIVAALERAAPFLSAALPLKVYPPVFNRYEHGQNFGTHVDGAIRQVPGTPIASARISRPPCSCRRQGITRAANSSSKAATARSV